MKHHILSIGITKYQVPEANNLEYAAKDAEDFYNLFCNNLEGIGYKKLLVDSEASLTQIRTALGKELQSEVKPDDTLFIFFSGHGATDTNEDGTLAHFLVPYDATYDIASSGISVTFLKKALDEITCKAKVVFIDSCFSGSATSKSFPVAAKKDFATSQIKTLLNTVSGSGEIVMTASKDSEESIEDRQNKNGLFTYFLLLELQKENGRENIPVETIFTPISEAVSKRATEIYHHTQTPTIGGVIQGGLLLPKFVNKLSIKPSFISMPKYSSSTNTEQIPIAEVELSNKEQEKQLREQIGFITSTTSMDQKIQKLEFEKLCKKMFLEIAKKYDELFTSIGSDLSKLSEAVATLEATSLQFIMFGNVAAAYGNTAQMEIYSYYVGEILKLGEGRAGLVVLTTIPEIIVADIISSVGIGCIAREDIAPLTMLLYANVSLNYNAPLHLFQYNHIFYCDAVGGNSTKVQDHIRALLASYLWLPEVAPRLDQSKILDYDLQLNLLMVILIMKNDLQLWADFGRFEEHRIKPFLERIAGSSTLVKQLAQLFEVKENEVKDLIIRTYMKVHADWRSISSGFWWRSIDNPAEILYTAEELKKRNAEEK